MWWGLLCATSAALAVADVFLGTTRRTRTALSLAFIACDGISHLWTGCYYATGEHMWGTVAAYSSLESIFDSLMLAAEGVHVHPSKAMLAAGLRASAMCVYVWWIDTAPRFLSLWLLTVAWEVCDRVVQPAVAPFLRGYKLLHDDAIHKACTRSRFPHRVYMCQSSERCVHAHVLPINAHIVLSDMLMFNASDVEVEALLEHEMGHWVHNHAWKRWGAAHCETIFKIGLLTLILASPKVHSIFNIEERRRQTYVGICIFRALHRPVQRLWQVALSAQSRQHEREADAYAACRGFAAPLAKCLAANAPTGPADGWTMRCMTATHPTPQERIAYLLRAASRTAG